MTLIIATVAIFVISTLISVYAFLILPRITDTADTELISCDFARNGLWSKSVPEGSLAAFYAAIERGYGISLSVRLSADKKLMVFDDENLLRLCSVKGRVERIDSAHLKSLSLMGTNQKIPYLSQVLRLCDGRVPVLIEIKCEPFDTRVCRRVANLLDTYGGAFAIQSADPKVLGWFKEFRPSFARGQIVVKSAPRKSDGKFEHFLRSNMMMNFISRPDFLVIDGKCARMLSVKICVGLFKTKAFARVVRNKAAYRFCRKKAFHAIFEGIRP